MPSLENKIRKDYSVIAWRYENHSNKPTSLHYVAHGTIVGKKKQYLQFKEGAIPVGTCIFAHPDTFYKTILPQYKTRYEMDAAWFKKKFKINY